jgi:trehalose-6-phosphate synthase
MGGLWVHSAIQQGGMVDFPRIGPSGRGRTEPYSRQSVQVDPIETRYFYEGYSNNVLWPLFHSFTEKVHNDDLDWRIYNSVNQKFAAQVTPQLSHETVLWIHDYHFYLLPSLVDRAIKIGFSNHIPFPPFNILVKLPHHQEILKGMLGADLIGFQCDVDLINFLDCVQLTFGADVSIKDHDIQFKDRASRVVSSPVGIDFDLFDKMDKGGSRTDGSCLIRRSIKTRWIGLGVDRLGYTKGILEKLSALECFFETYPGYRRQLAFVQVLAPSRSGEIENIEYKRLVERSVDRINGKFGTDDWLPIHYHYKSFSAEGLACFYDMADFYLATPLRDGMNLTAKEFIACKTDHSGALILSKYTGASEKLTEAFIVDPRSKGEVAEAVRDALITDPRTLARNMAQLRLKVKDQDVHWWAQGFLDSLRLLPDRLEHG